MPKALQPVTGITTSPPALAVSTRERSELLPELPGMREAGPPEYNLAFWYGVFVPAGTPQAIRAQDFTKRPPRPCSSRT